MVLSQEWAKPWGEESRILKLRPGRRAIVREVALQGGDQPLVVARSVIPARTLRGADRRLANLGTKPLGHILFNDPRLRRLHLSLTRVAPTDWRPVLPFQEIPNEPVWGRRSLYSLGPGHTLLVAEFFLPTLLHRHEPA
jgi:chorismate--pyruvate lyase